MVLVFLQIDYLVNNAGRSQRAEAIATELGVDRALIDLNVLSTLSLTKAVLPEMIECREGCVVVISSVAGKIGKNCSNVLIELALYHPLRFLNLVLPPPTHPTPPTCRSTRICYLQRKQACITGTDAVSVTSE